MVARRAAAVPRAERDARQRAGLGRPPRRGEHRYGLAGRGAVLLLGLVSVAISTRYLGADLYGRFALALSFVQLFGVLADAGLTTIVVRELAQQPERARRRCRLGARAALGARGRRRGGRRARSRWCCPTRPRCASPC